MRFGCFAPTTPPRSTSKLDYVKGHLKHLAMCSPMVVLAIVLIATGTGVAVLIPVAACVLMMG
jgi:hypothetical protein